MTGNDDRKKSLEKAQSDIECYMIISSTSLR